MSTARLCDQCSAGKLEDQLPVRDLIALVGALDDIGQLTNVKVGVASGPPLGGAIDATAPGDLTGAIVLAGSVPVLRPLWRRVRTDCGEIDEVFDGYGRLTKGGVEPLADAALRRP